MANSTKKTQRDFYNEILNGYALTDEQKEFIKGRIAQLDKKASASSGKQTATQKANVELKDKILAEMESGKAYTISDMLKAFECCADLSNQKVSAIMKQLVESYLVVRTEDKRKAFFTKA
jgi:hypothetical protein